MFSNLIGSMLAAEPNLMTVTSLPLSLREPWQSTGACIHWRALCLCVFFCFYSAAGVSASFGEMLLLVAMYFHSNQLTSIIELVCSTLGMKVRLTVNASVWPSSRQPDTPAPVQRRRCAPVHHHHQSINCYLYCTESQPEAS